MQIVTPPPHLDDLFKESSEFCKEVLEVLERVVATAPRTADGNPDGNDHDFRKDLVKELDVLLQSNYGASFILKKHGLKIILDESGSHYQFSKALDIAKLLGDLKIFDKYLAIRHLGNAIWTNSQAINWDILVAPEMDKATSVCPEVQHHLKQAGFQEGCAPIELYRQLSVLENSLRDRAQKLNHQMPKRWISPHSLFHVWGEVGQGLMHAVCVCVTLFCFSGGLAFMRSGPPIPPSPLPSP